MADGGLRVEPHAEQQRRPGHLWSCGPLKHPGRAAARVNTELLKPRIEQRCRTRDPHVAGERQVEPGADRGPVDCRDRRQDAVRDSQKPVVDLMQALWGRGAAQVGQVGPGAKRAAGAGDDHGMHIRVGLGTGHRGPHPR